ncbi:MAG: hypothetical protein SFU25_06610 [Candidatus Caenarcaniphilales bacterium]|nr:hypothetical protein [Candidatus Caenarcaniphilales bacterium]
MRKEFKRTILKFTILLYIVGVSSIVVNAWTDEKAKVEKSKDNTSIGEEKIDKKPKEGFFASIAQMRKDLSKVR